MKTIAVVDDDEDLRSLMALRLRAAGYEVRQSGDGIAGLELIRAWLPDLVVVDWMMPGLTGIEVSREMRRDAELATIPILLVTSRTSASDLTLSLAAGVTSMLLKPFTLAAFLDVVRGLLEPEPVSEPRQSGAGCH